MHFDRDGSSEEDRPPAGSHPITRGRAIWPAAGVLLALVLLGARLGFGFYAPARGAVASGDPSLTGHDVPRDRARVRVEAAMAPAPGGRPSLADVARFYGLDDEAIACSVQEAHDLRPGDARLRVLAERPLRVGEEVELCLD